MYIMYSLGSKKYQNDNYCKILISSYQHVMSENKSIYCYWVIWQFIRLKDLLSVSFTFCCHSQGDKDYQTGSQKHHHS